MKILAALFFAAVLPAAAQKVEVPQKLNFAGITLVIRDDARREIQRDVDALTASPRHYQIKAERAKTYFPIIEKIFREEGIPDDFKYLVLQESALIADAVSTSNAVGFWQFKDFTAIEMGLRVDRHIDERLNIVSSTRAAARYLTKNNQFFDNWLYALQAYQMGAGGVMKSVEDTQAQATRMEITGKTYWYVKKFLAHKVAYEGGVRGTPQKQVVVFENRIENTLDRLAKETMVDEAALKDLNQWTKSGVIPDDKTYVVLLPVEGGSVPDAQSSPVRVVSKDARHSEEKSTSAKAKISIKGKIHGIHTIQALAGDDARRLTARSGIDYPKFLKWNDLRKDDAIIAGQNYFLGRKRLKGSETFHKVSSGESLWSISQQYGIQEKRLRSYNRIEEDIEPAPGTMLYLASKRPKADAVIAKVENAVEVDNQETFNWSVKTESLGEDLVTSDPVSLTPPSDVENTGQEGPTKVVDSVKILQTNRTSPTLEDTQAEISLPLPENMEHAVKPGETLYGIARVYDLAVMEIVSLNDLDLQDGIKPGQVLKLSPRQPPSDSGQDVVKTDKVVFNGEIFHQVKTSDTLYGIARQYNVTIKEIMEWNEKKDFSLSVGEKLKILRSQ
ncbi:MAG: LysM peptidoglycan-binding domain-containing protein [Cyclobacteriaceae bacterium]